MQRGVAVRFVLATWLLLSAPGISMGAGLSPAASNVKGDAVPLPTFDPDGKMLYGEIWHVCHGNYAGGCYLAITFTGEAWPTCDPLGPGRGLDAWGPTQVGAFLPRGTYYAWTMAELGGQLTGEHLSGIFVGSGCTVTNSDRDVFFAGFGVFREACVPPFCFD